ncbi:MAG TPA: NYN domain-containing protein [Acidobacteriota bacterium]|nr:NYN domain-containing protein [Acidobacteriota bacterium]
MNNSSEERLKIAVFVDFDNIAIGVKQSLSRNFDIGTVLEAIKEKGQVISKIAYGDWKRAEDYSRAMTQHAVQMVQRNLTPGGDKNGADIALALDALEMVFTRSHINAFVIVGGDSDFIALVEKLKQFDKTVFVVGGRAFTSVILQKNCHEFISYENLVGIQTGSRRTSGKTQTSSTASLESALPLIRRALKILSDREVSPQLGLLKSTLLQLDSTFSERNYGVSSFRDFIQKLSNASYITLKQVDRSLLVELKESQEESKVEAQEFTAAAPEGVPEIPFAPEQPTVVAPASEATRILEELLRESKIRPHWPMYLRTFKQYLRSLQPPFDERQCGITSTYDLVRQLSRDGLLRVERNRQGILRIFPAERFPRPVQEQPVEAPIPAETAEFTAPVSEPEISSRRREPELEPEATQEAATTLTETLPEPAESLFTPEEEPATPVEEAEGKPAQKPKAKPRKKTSYPRSAKARGETRKSKSAKEKSKEAGPARTA